MPAVDLQQSSRPSLRARIFLEHPESVDETYFQHMRFAAWFSARLAVAAGAALVHAVVPALCEATASRTVRELFARIEHRGPQPD